MSHSCCVHGWDRGTGTLSHSCCVHVSHKWDKVPVPLSHPTKTRILSLVPPVQTWKWYNWNNIIIHQLICLGDIENMINVYGVKLDQELEPLQIQTLMAALPVEKQYRINRFVQKEDALRALTSDILSRISICIRLKIRNNDIHIVTNKYGKPLFQGNDELHFNNSHSGQWVVCAISDSPVGIDVEKVRDIDFNIGEHCFSEKEYLDLSAQTAEAKLDYFYDLWTLKESYIKAVGLGLSLPLSSFTIRKNGHHILLNTPNELNPCFFRQYPIDSAYKMSVCAQHDRFPDHIRLISLDTLYQEFMTYC